MKAKFIKLLIHIVSINCQLLKLNVYYRYRQKEKISAAILIKESSQILFSQDKFLSNILNKKY